MLDRQPQLINEAKKGGATALYLASQNGHPGVVSYLIDSRARPSTATKYMKESTMRPCEIRGGQVLEA